MSSVINLKELFMHMKTIAQSCYLKELPNFNVNYDPINDCYKVFIEKNKIKELDLNHYKLNDFKNFPKILNEFADLCLNDLPRDDRFERKKYLKDVFPKYKATFIREIY